MNHDERRKEIQGFLEKIVISAGIGRMSQLPNFEEKALPQVKRDIALMTGQAPEITRARKSIAGFKIREGQIVGVKVTLRRKKMVDFFERFISIVLPRVRDFGGISLVSIDHGGVLTTGVREHVVFPEITPEQSPIVFSLAVSLVPRKRDREAGMEEYKKLGVPFKKGAGMKSNRT